TDLICRLIEPRSAASLGVIPDIALAVVAPVGDNAGANTKQQYGMASFDKTASYKLAKGRLRTEGTTGYSSTQRVKYHPSCRDDSLVVDGLPKRATILPHALDRHTINHIKKLTQRLLRQPTAYHRLCFRHPRPTLGMKPGIAKEL